VAAALRQAPAELAAELAPRLRAGERVGLAVEGLGTGGVGPEEVPGGGGAGRTCERAPGWRGPPGSSWPSRPTETSPTRSPPTATTCSTRPWPPASIPPPRATATTPGWRGRATRSGCGCGRSSRGRDDRQTGGDRRPWRPAAGGAVA